MENVVSWLLEEVNRLVRVVYIVWRNVVGLLLLLLLSARDGEVSM